MLSIGGKSTLAGLLMGTGASLFSRICTAFTGSAFEFADFDTGRKDLSVHSEISLFDSSSKEGISQGLGKTIPRRKKEMNSASSSTGRTSALVIDREIPSSNPSYFWNITPFSSPSLDASLLKRIRQTITFSFRQNRTLCQMSFLFTVSLSSTHNCAECSCRILADVLPLI